MIITCPECATRYDLEDERFLPNGRSVRCTACGESWFVPAPEPIEALSRREPAPRHAFEPHREPRPDMRREPYPEERPEPRPEPRHEPHQAYARDEERDYPRDRFEQEDARSDDDRRDDHRGARMGADQPLRADNSVGGRPEPATAFRFDDDGYDGSGQPEEAEVSIVSEEKDLLPPRDEKGRFMPREASAGSGADRLDDDEDDTLFEAPAAARSSVRENDPRNHAAREAEDDTPPKGWRKGKQFYVEDTDEEPEEDPRPFFAKHFSKNKRGEAAPRSVRRDREEDAGAQRDAMRFGDEADLHRERSRHQAPRSAQQESHRDARLRAEADDREAYAGYENDHRARGGRDYYERDRDHDRDMYADRDGYEARDRDHRDNRDYDDVITPGEATVLDADWEDVDDGTGPRFGRRIREERRRATALARLEDVRRFEPDTLDDEFFRSLRVTPHELEKAVRKARRRAEARDKNRLTPWRAFGWSAWVAAVAGAAYAVVAYRDEIVKAAPTAADAYAVVGIETDPFGLQIENVSHRLAMSTGGPMIEISGALRNRGGDAIDAPLLQAEALGPRGELLARWTFRPEEPSVGGNDVVSFTTRNAAPEGVAEVALSFAPGQSAYAHQ